MNMKKLLLCGLFIALAFASLHPSKSSATTSNNLSATPNKAAKRKVLYLTHSAGFKHDVLPLSEKILKEIGERSGAFEATVTQDCSVISKDGLKPYDAVVFY